jgi:hypothetical protein
MRNFVATLGRAPGNVAATIAIVASIAAALTIAVVVSGLVSRVQKLESELGALRSDLDRPRPRPLASILDTAPRPRQ